MAYDGIAVNARLEAAEAYVQALRTGEGSAADRAAAFLAPDVVLVDGSRELTGRDRVLPRITGWWPFTAKYRRGAWSEPRLDGESAVVTSELPAPGAGPASIEIRFSFNSEDRVSHVQYQSKQAPTLETNEIPDFVKGIVDPARMNNAPLTVAYTGEDGAPVLSFRGSVQVCSPTQLSMWMRNAEGSMTKALAKDPRVALSYFDQSNTWLLIEGRASLVNDPAIRRRVFDLLPEVERNHDPDCTGAALLVEVERLDASTAFGRVRMAREPAR